MSDRLQDMRVALVAILTADLTLQSLCGRVSRLIAVETAWDTLPLPGLTYVLVLAQSGGAEGVAQTVSIQLTGWADGDDALATAGALLVAAMAALTPAAFAGQGLDVRPLPSTRREAPVDPQGARRLARADVDLSWVVTG